MGTPIHVSQVLGQIGEKIEQYEKHSSHPEQRTLSLTEIQVIPFLMTYSQMQEYGFVIPNVEPKREKCQFCKNELPWLGQRSITKNTILKWKRPMRCGCDKAVEYWLGYDLERKTSEAGRASEQLRTGKLKTRMEKLFLQSQMGKRFLTRRFANFNMSQENTDAYAIAREYVESFKGKKEEGRGIIFAGSCGVGKTHLAAAISIDLMEKGIPVIFGTLGALLGKIKQSFGGESIESEQKLIQLFSTVDLLVIDDLGKERPNEWTVQMLYSIINNRYENCLPVIITTNYDEVGLSERLTVGKNRGTAMAIISRLRESCEGVYLDGPDYRRSTHNTL